MDVRQGSKYVSASPHIFLDPGDHLDQGDIMFRKEEEEEIFGSHGDTAKMSDAGGGLQLQSHMKLITF